MIVVYTLSPPVPKTTLGPSHVAHARDSASASVAKRPVSPRNASSARASSSTQSRAQNGSKSASSLPCDVNERTKNSDPRLRQPHFNPLASHDAVSEAWLARS